jgi:CheY-like chemotaxis protein
VDDDFIVRDVISDLLESTGKYAVVQAVNGQDALDKLTAEPGIKLIISDVNMPTMDGFAMLKELRARGVKIPTLMLTGFNMPHTGVTALTLGATDYLEKDDKVQEALIPWVETTLSKLP